MYKFEVEPDNIYDIEIAGNLYKAKKMGYGTQLELARLDAKMKNSDQLSADELTALIEELYATFFSSFKPQKDAMTIKELLNTMSMQDVTRLIKYITDINGGSDGQTADTSSKATVTN